MKTTVSLQDALSSNNTAAADDEPAHGVTVGDIRRWHDAEKELLVSLVKGQIAFSQSQILLEQSEAAREEMAKTSAAHARNIVQLQSALREATS